MFVLFFKSDIIVAVEQKGRIKKMLLCVGIAVLTAAAMIISVLFKPYINFKKSKVGLYWVVCLIGAMAMLFTGRIDLSTVIDGITADTSVNPLKILTLFLSMTLLSVYLGDAGFFDLVADKVFLKSKGGQLKLFLILYAVVSVLTVFTSNDVIILTFTPPICIFAKKAKISPLPYLFGEFIAANTWSMMLIVGNPTNVYLAQSAGINFLSYFSVMFLPALLGGIVSLIMLLLLFRKQLSSPVCHQTQLETPKLNSVTVHKFPMTVAIVHLLVCILMLAFSDLLHVEMWLICLILALSLTVFDLFYDELTMHTVRPVFHSIKKEPYELIPFVLSMFIIVLALKNNGVTDLLKTALVGGKATDGVSFGFLSALSANLLNNIPMSVLFEKIISNASLSAVYGAIIGSNVGAFITPVGALAGIMWSKILAKYGIKMPFIKFMTYGALIAIPTLTASTLALLLVF